MPGKLSATPSYSCRIKSVSRYLTFVMTVPGYDAVPDDQGPCMRHSQKHGQRKSVTRFCHDDMPNNQELKCEERI